MENVKGKTRKNERIPPVSCRRWALAYSRDQPWIYDFSMPVSGVEKPPFLQFSLGFGVSFGEEKPFVVGNASF